MAALTLGPNPGPLNLYYVLGDPWTSSLTLKEAGVPVSWPAAPVLEFAAGITWPSTLSEAGVKATWTRTEADITALDTAVDVASSEVRLAVDGVTQWVGRVVRRA